MKRLWIIAMIIGVLYSCKGNSPKVKTETAGALTEQIAASGIHNARTALDYQGTYAGKLPIAGGKGMIVIMTLGNDTYIKRTKYVGKEGVSEAEGSFAWDESGNVIILEDMTGAPNKYFVSEGRIFQLDMDGNWISERFDEKYALHKQKEEATP